MSYKYAVLFPGQGAQYENISKDILESEYKVKKYYSELSSCINNEKANKVIEANGADISKTAIAQLAIFLNSVSLYDIFKEKYENIKIEGAAGLSLGEYSAHYAAGVIGLTDSIKLIDRRGDIMTEYASGKGRMLAVLKTSIDVIEDIISEIKSKNDGVLSICNLNCPGQTVVGGDFSLIGKFYDLCKSRGIRKVIELDVEGPFHTEILKVASEEFYDILSSCKFNDFKFDVYSNLTGLKYNGVESISDTLKKQMYSQVKFESMIREMIKDGFNRFIEIGPGNTLKNFIKKIDKSIEVFNIQSLDDINNGGLDEL